MAVPDVAVGAVRFLGSQDWIASVVLGSEYMLATGPHPARLHRIRYSRRGEGHLFQSVRRVGGGICQRVRNPVHIVLLLWVVADLQLTGLKRCHRELLVCAGCIVAVAATISNVDLQPVVPVVDRLPRAVVLGPGAEALRVRAVVVDGIGCKRSQTAVNCVQRLRDAREYDLAECQPCGDDKVVWWRRT